MRTTPLFILLSVVGVAEAFYHAWLENAFSTNWFTVTFAPYASFFGVPYWVFGIVWFPLVLVYSLWRTTVGRKNLTLNILVLLTVGNIFTGYLWFVDVNVIHTFNPAYVGLYVTNYALTGIVVIQNWSNAAARDFAVGTILGMVIGVFFGPFGVALFGITGGIFGAIAGYTSKT